MTSYEPAGSPEQRRSRDRRAPVSARAMIICGLVVIAAPDAAVAQGQAASDQEPWSEGISVEDRRQAEDLYEEGNGLLEQGLFAEALVKYREALVHWEEHPRIHYKIVAVLELLGQFDVDPAAAYEHVRRALRHDGKGLDADLLDKARGFARSLRARLVELQVRCDQPGVAIELDGALLMTGPGTVARLVVPGAHQITASKPGYLTVNESLSLLLGQDHRLDLRLFTLADSSVTTRRWKRWKPWAAAGAGAALILVGGTLHWRAQVNMGRFDRDLEDRCLRRVSCGGLDGRSPWLSEAQETAAFAAYGIGAATLAAGLFLAYTNRSQSYHIDRRKESLRISVTPAVSRETASVRALLRF